VAGARRIPRADDFGPLLVGHELFMCFVTVAEIQTFLQMEVLAQERSDALRSALSDYALLEVRLTDVATEWTSLRASSASLGTVDDRERRQNDTWIAACALSVDPCMPVVTGNLRDFLPLASVSQLTVVHPDLP
jgi:predicted nucleic acid-binding protein